MDFGSAHKHKKTWSWAINIVNRRTVGRSYMLNNVLFGDRLQGCFGQFNSIWHLLRGIALFGGLIRSRLTHHENSKLSLLGILSMKPSFTYIYTAVDYVINMLYNRSKLSTWLRISMIFLKEQYIFSLKNHKKKLYLFVRTM